MNINVTKDNVCIINKEYVHEGEYKINELSFDFSEEYTPDLVINAVFTNELGKAYQMSIIDNKCHIPAEILADTGQVLLGVYAYKVNGKELELRYSPFPTSFNVISGSYDPSAEESQEITSTQFEQYMQALNDGLNQVKDSISELNQATDNANDLVDEINQKLENGDFIGPQGPIGPQGEPGKDGTNGIDGVGITTITSGQATEENGNTITPITVEKTDGTSETFNVSAKNGIDGKDGQNGKDGINGTNGVDGQDGITPNIQIGTVETLEPTEEATVTRTGTDEEPVFNFGIPKGDKGDPGEVTEETLDNIVPKQTATDSIINVNDALKYKTFNFKVDGAYEQTTSDGSNLLDIDYSEFPKEQGELHVELNDDYSFAVTGTKTTTGWNNVSISLKTPIYFKTGVKYYIKDVIVFLYDTSGKWVKNIDNDFIPDQDYIAEDIPNVKGAYWTTNKQGTINETIRPYVGTVPYDESKYYKYTGGIASPNPDYPQEITPLSFDKITKRGQNLLNLQDVEERNVQGVKVTVNNNKIILNGTVSTAGQLYIANIDNLNLNGTYTMKIFANNSVNNNYRLYIKNGENELISCTYQDNHYSASISSQATGITMFLNQGTVFSNHEIQIMLVRGNSQPSVYQPYQYTEYPINLQGNEMVSLPNGIKDELQIDKEGNVNLIKKVGKKTLIDTDVVDITDDWFTNLAFSNIIKPTDYKGYNNYDMTLSYNNVVMDKFYMSPDSTPKETYDKVYSFISFMSTWSIGFTFPKGTTLEQAREMGAGTVMYYELAEPQTISLGKLSDLITTEQGSNTFAINGNIDTQISTTYALDLKKYIDNKISTVSQAVLEQE